MKLSEPCVHTTALAERMSNLSKILLWALNHPAAVRTLLENDYLHFRLDELHLVNGGRLSLAEFQHLIMAALRGYPQGMNLRAYMAKVAPAQNGHSCLSTSGTVHTIHYSIFACWIF